MLRDYKCFIENILPRRFWYIFAVEIKHRRARIGLAANGRHLLRK